jgi:hypothetical protein
MLFVFVFSVKCCKLIIAFGKKIQLENKFEKIPSSAVIEKRQKERAK